MTTRAHQNLEQLAGMGYGVWRVERIARQFDVIAALELLPRHALADEPNGVCE